MLQKGQLLPDITLSDDTGQSHRLWDYRQKTHLALLLVPDASADELRAHKEAIASRRKTWDWLHLKILVVTQPVDGFFAGIQAIDRYGKFIASFPASVEAWADVEKEFIYYEARHCG
jgi:hypothetical protein